MVRGPWDKKKRRWITNSAGVDLLELASVAGTTLPRDWIVQRVRATEFQNLGMKSLQRACDATRPRTPELAPHRPSGGRSTPSRLASHGPPERACAGP